MKRFQQPQVLIQRKILEFDFKGWNTLSGIFFQNYLKYFLEIVLKKLIKFIAKKFFFRKLEY